MNPSQILIGENTPLRKWKFLLLRNASDLYNWIKQRGYLKKIINIFKEYGIYGKPVVVQWYESNVGKDKYCPEFMDYIYELTMK